MKKLISILLMVSFVCCYSVSFGTGSWGNKTLTKTEELVYVLSLYIGDPLEIPSKELEDSGVDMFGNTNYVVVNKSVESNIDTMLICCGATAYYWEIKPDSYWIEKNAFVESVPCYYYSNSDIAVYTEKFKYCSLITIKTFDDFLLAIDLINEKTTNDSIQQNTSDDKYLAMFSCVYRGISVDEVIAFYGNPSIVDTEESKTDLTYKKADINSNINTECLTEYGFADFCFIDGKLNSFGLLNGENIADCKSYYEKVYGPATVSKVGVDNAYEWQSNNMTILVAEMYGPSTSISYIFKK